MKTLLVLSLLFSVIALPALGELTDADIDEIGLIVNEAVNSSEKRIKAEIRADIAKSEKNLKEFVTIKIDAVEKRLSTYNWVLYVLMPLIVVAIGVPTAIMAWRSGKDRSLERQVETLTREVEALKQQRPLITP